MFFLSSFTDLQLDIVGIVAILGEASVLRISQISALSWHHELPRLMPAPQALLKHSLERRLPTEAGKVVGAYSGNVNLELNFFCQLLHPHELDHYQVEFVTIKKRKGLEDSPPYEVNPSGSLRALSLLGLALSVTLIALAAVYDDGWALVGTILLSITSTLVGFASRVKLEVQQPPKDRLTKVHDSDVVIYYPRTGAFRVVRCSEFESRLYFTSETCKPLFDDSLYRAFALCGTVTLIFGLISIGNAQTILQVTFAATYVLLNITYWLASAISSHKHWKHNYDVQSHAFELPAPAPTPAVTLTPDASTTIPGRTTTFVLPVQETNDDVERNITRRIATTRTRVMSLQRRYTGNVTIAQSNRIFTTALWETIALTGTGDWLRRTNIAPKNDVWDKWISLAGEAARMDEPDCRGTHSFTTHGRTRIVLSAWPYRQVLARLFEDEQTKHKWRPEWSNQQLSDIHPEIVQSKPEVDNADAT
ncbi:hypothetical protein LTS08_008158 [Lithohypha guttulata]|nr:hypothetical protein LTS08_008158 [Lithohypha guttulata]